MIRILGRKLRRGNTRSRNTMTNELWCVPEQEARAISRLTILSVTLEDSATELCLQLGGHEKARSYHNWCKFAFVRA